MSNLYKQYKSTFFPFPSSVSRRNKFKIGAYNDEFGSLCILQLTETNCRNIFWLASISLMKLAKETKE